MNHNSRPIQVDDRAPRALIPRPHWVILAVSAIASILTVTPGFAAPDPKHVSDTAPWSNVNRHFAAAIRSGFQVPVTPNPNWKIGQTLADGSVYMISGDLPGWSRSIDGGKRFESAVAGPAFSKNICGGYDETWYASFEPSWAQFCSASGPNAEAIREWQEVSPPVAVPAFYGAAASSGRTVTSGPVPPTMNISQHDAVCRGPANEPGCAKDIIYTGNDWWSFFSPDAGRQWFRFTPQCEMRQPVGWSAIAADRGIGQGAHNFGGHIVAVARSWPGSGAPREACGGAPVSGCQQRSIAWTDDVGEELSESILGTTVSPTSSSSRRRTEGAGGGGADVAADSTHLPEWAERPKWRYATIAHLPAGLDLTRQCRVKELTLPEFEIAQDTQPNTLEASIPPRTCDANRDSRCHARKAKEKAESTTSPPIDRDAWCLDFGKASCSCKDGPASNCRYPDPTSAAIDPRNGWAYLTTAVGLLASPNGGRSWIRQGGAPQSNPADVFKKMTNVDVFVDDPSVRGARLYTQQFYCNQATDPSCQQDPSQENSLDLNGEPWRILSMGKVDMAFTPCQAEVYYAATPAGGGYGPTPPKRKRGQLSAVVAVEWLVVGHDGTERRTSGVFVAHQRDACDPQTPEAPPPGALEFWDTAHLLRPASPHISPS